MTFKLGFVGCTTKHGDLGEYGICQPTQIDIVCKEQHSDLRTLRRRAQASGSVMAARHSSSRTSRRNHAVITARLTSVTAAA